MAAETTAQKELVAKHQRLIVITELTLPKLIAKVAEIDAKLASGKFKAGGPKAKLLAQHRESIRLYELEANRLDGEILALMIAEETNVEDMTPEQIDMRLFSIWSGIYTAKMRIYEYRESLAISMFPSVKVYNKYGQRKTGIGPTQANQWLAALTDWEERLEALKAEAEPYEHEYEKRGGWIRYVLCGNNNGHLHYHGCHTLRWDTSTLLVAQASGLDADEVVGRFGTVACTKCFTDAPV